MLPQIIIVWDNSFLPFRRQAITCNDDDLVCQSMYAPRGRPESICPRCYSLVQSFAFFDTNGVMYFDVFQCQVTGVYQASFF